MATGPNLTPERLPGPEPRSVPTPHAPGSLTVPNDGKRETDCLETPDTDSRPPDPAAALASPDWPSMEDNQIPAWQSPDADDQTSALTIKSPTRPKAPAAPSEPQPGRSPPTVLEADTPGVTTTPPRTASQPILRVVRGESPNQTFPLLDGRNFLGRNSPDKPVDVDLTYQEALERVWSSRQHAVVTLDRGTAVVEDLNSLNGTFVNRARLHPGQRRALEPGDVVQIGTVQLRYEV